MDTPTRILLEQIGWLGYRIAIARDHVELMTVDPACQGFDKELPRFKSEHVSHSTAMNLRS